MILPKTINVLGHQWHIIETDDDSILTSDDNQLLSGQMSSPNHTIYIRRTQMQSDKWTTLFHEIIEVVKQSLQIKIEHDDVCRLETGVYQVLHDNKLKF